MNTLQQVDHKPGTKQGKSQERVSSRKQLKYYSPKDLNTLLYALFVLVYLGCAIIRFARTDDSSMLIALLPYISAYAGIHKIVHHLPLRR